MNKHSLESPQIDKISYCLFGLALDESSKNDFLRISTHVLNSYPEQQVSETCRILNYSELSLSAYELVLRFTDKRHLLCSLFKLMIHFIETQPRYRHLIIRYQHNKFLSLLKTISFGFRTIFIIILCVPILIHRKAFV